MQKLNFIFDPEKVFQNIIGDILTKHGVLFKHSEMGQVLIGQDIPEKTLSKISKDLSNYEIEVLGQEDTNLVEKIKNCLKMMINDSSTRKKKVSSVLADKLNLKYSFLSKHFTTETFTTIEKFYLTLKVEKAKELLMRESTTVSDVALRLDYSSTSHLSRQFKNVTGLSISQYLKLIESRKLTNRP